MVNSCFHSKRSKYYIQFQRDRTNFAIAQFQEIDVWKVAEMTGIQKWTAGVVTSFTILQIENVGEGASRWKKQK